MESGEMTAIIMVGLLTAGFLVMALFLLHGKGSWLIAGFNTASKEEKAKYDEKKLCRAVGWGCVSFAVGTAFLDISCILVSLDQITENDMGPVAGVFAAILFVTAGILIFYTNTRCKK